ncbi:uncharacterized protein LOC130048364 [Ostrea edulis]|uniref:uncharacterized protein LOC130048364 n=1 Tax=Ostrea edulis TaxID=37623 RepID=UPI0024AF3998|nr:uncharacterized protein LOC130048364 [Ostrea edulis]
MSDVLKCVYCKMVLVEPMTLICLHSLCKKCFIKMNKEQQEGFDKESCKSALQCPACEYVSSLEITADDVIKDKNRSLVAPQVLLTLLDYEMERRDPQCIPCKNRGKFSASIFWCFDCAMYLCEECLRFHSSLPFLEKHKTYRREEMSEYVRLFSSARELCEKHGLRFTRFCKVKESVCCDGCISSDHMDICSGKHTEIPGTISSLVDSKLSALKHSITTLKEEIDSEVKLTSDTEHETDGFFQDKMRNPGEIVVRIRSRLLEKTDTLLAESYKIAFYQLQEVESKITSFIQKKYVLENALSIISALRLGSEVRFFLEKKKVNNIITDARGLIANHVRVEIKNPSISFDGWLERACNLAEFGTINKMQNARGSDTENSCNKPIKDHIESKPNNITRWESELNISQPRSTQKFGMNEGNRCFSEMNLSSIVPNDVDIPCVRTFMFDCKTFSLSRTIKVEDWRSHITGCAWKSENEIIIVDQKAKGKPDVRIYNTDDGTLKYTIPLREKPYDVAVLPENQFVMTFPNKQEISLFTFGDCTSKRDIDVDINCYGVTHCPNGTIIVSGETYLVFYDKYFYETKRIIVNGEGIRYVHAYNNNLIFYSEMEGKNVCSVIGNGDTRFRYHDDEMKGPAGLILDVNKNVYVCEKGSRFLHVLNKSGIFVEKFEVGGNPTALSLSEDRKKICIIRGGRKNINVADIYISE